MATGSTNAISVLSGGSGAVGNDFSLLTPTFMAKNKASDITLAVNTTWSDAIGYKRVGKLTINAGIVLTIERAPFYIFADEIAFGSTTSIIDASSKNGNHTSPVTFPAYMVAGGLANDVGTGRKAQAGGGGGMLFVLANKISGANGVIKANGGNGSMNSLEAGTETVFGWGGGALVDYKYGWNGSTSNFLPDRDFRLGLEGFDLTRVSYTGSNVVNLSTIGYFKDVAVLLGKTSSSMGGASGYVNGSGGGVGSGIGSGGGYTGLGTANGYGPGTVGVITPTPEDLWKLGVLGCRGGGGGSARVVQNANMNHAGGGGGGAIVVWVHEKTATPTLQANGGVGVFGSAISGSLTSTDGGAGLTYLIEG